MNIDTEEFGASVMIAFGYRKDEAKKEKKQNKNWTLLLHGIIKKKYIKLGKCIWEN